MSEREVVNPDVSLYNYIRSVPDFPKPGILFRDISPLLGKPTAFHNAIGCMEKIIKIDILKGADGWGALDIAAIESRGFPFGAPLADRLWCGLALIRKRDAKLPGQVLVQEYDLEYGKDAIKIQADAIDAGREVVVVDDVLATGGTAEAAYKLVERAGGKTIACVFLIELKGFGGRERLEKMGVQVRSLLQY